jgi:polysaccharide biosynthesis protein PslF
VARVLGELSKATVIPHAIPEISEDNRSLDAQCAKRSLGLEGKAVLTIFGFINRKKDYELALEALAHLPEGFFLLIAGGIMHGNFMDKEYYAALRKKIESLSLEHRVKITGYLSQERIPLVMAATDICLAPFRPFRQPGSGSLSLCVGYGKPIIASDIEMIKEINNRVPFLDTFTYPSKDDLLLKINNLFHHKERRDELVRLTNAYRQQYSYSKIAELLFGVYQDIASRNHGH